MADDGISRRALLAAIGASAGGASLLTGRSGAVLTDRESFPSAIGGETLDLKVGYETAVTRDGERSVVAANPDLDGEGEMAPPPYDDPCSVLPDPASVPNPLFELEDVRPGDSGRALLPVHVCGTDATVTIEGELTANRENGVVPAERPDRTDETGELADLLEARLWYDQDCDGTRGEAEPIIASGTLREVLDRLAEGVRLSTEPTTESCQQLGEITADEFAGREASVFEFTMDGEPFRVRLSHVVTRSDLRNGGDTQQVERDSPTTTTETTPTATTTTETTATTTTTPGDGSNRSAANGDDDTADGKPKSSSDVVAVDFEVLEPNGAGVCRVDVETNDTTTRSLGCAEQGTVESASRGKGNGADQSREAIQSLTLYGCTGPAATCLPAGETTCLGFEWHLPDADGVAKAQTDAVAFDLGFSAEQCRQTGGDAA